MGAVNLQKVWGKRRFHYKKKMNMLRAIANGIHRNFTSKEGMERFPHGTKSNIVRIKNVLLEKELVELRETGRYMADPIF